MEGGSKEVLLVRRFGNCWWNSFRSCLLFAGRNWTEDRWTQAAVGVLLPC